MTNQPIIGTISHGTLRPEDLGPAFVRELDDLDNHRQFTTLINEAYAHDWEEDELSDELLVGLEDALDEFSPDGAYFGAHEGDGSDFGFWPSYDQLSEWTYTGEAVNVSSLPEYLIHTNDHGNITLYRVELHEIWSAV